MPESQLISIVHCIDDFETPAREGFLKLAEEREDDSLLRGEYVPWVEWRSPADACGLDVWLDVIALCHDDNAILSMQPYPGAAKTCQALLDAGHELVYISNRKTETETATRDWLWDHGFMDPDYPNTVSLVITSGDKKPFLEECRYIIDDRPKTVIEFVYDWDWQLRNPGLQRQAFVPMYQYNQNLTDIPNLYLAPTWAGLNKFLVRKGLLEVTAHNVLEPA